MLISLWMVIGIDDVSVGFPYWRYEGNKSEGKVSKKEVTSRGVHAICNVSILLFKIRS